RGCPVVVSDADGPRDIVDDGATGLMVKKDAPEPLAAALRRMVEDPELAARLAAAGEVSVRERFGAARVGDQLETAIGAVVAHYREAQRPQQRSA
ncbi:MAG: glycosyltransferase, partial [Alphaproteobacteria bacterium]